MGRRGGALLAAVVGVLAAMPGHASAAGWLEPAKTAPGSHEVDSEDIELDAQGNATAAWVEYAPWRVVRAATRPRGGAWSQPVTLSDPSEEGAWNPQVAVGADGDAVVVWASNYHPPASTQTVLAVTREAGGQWSEPVEISRQGGYELTWQPEVVVDAEGNATAVWSEETDLADAILTSTRPKGGEWSEPVELTTKEEGASDTPELAVDSQGDITAVWSWHPGESEGGIIQSATRPASGAWSAPVDLSEAHGKVKSPQLAVDPQGDAVAVWKSEAGLESVQAASRTANGSWGPVVDLSGGEAYEPDVAIDPQGAATAVWETNDGVGRLVHASTSSLGGPWSVPVDISERDEGEGIGASPQVVVDSQGNVTAAWRAYYVFGINYIQAARREAGGDWSQPVDVGRSSGALEDFPLAVDPQGYVTAGWSRGASVYSAVFDAVSPELNGLEVPTTGLVGQPVAMSVDPFDVWSPVATTWDFGDGGSGSGVTVEHCYSLPGEHTVTIAGTDGASNATSASRTITIEPDPDLAAGVDPCAKPEPPHEPEPEPEPPHEPAHEPESPHNPGPPDSPRPPDNPGSTDATVHRDSGPVAPLVSALRQSSSRWRMRGTRGRSRRPIRTTFRFQLNRPAQLRLAFSRIAPGGHAQARGTLVIAGEAGANVYAFEGKIRGHRLAPGRYRLRVTAIADGMTSAAASIRFTIVG